MGARSTSLVDTCGHSYSWSYADNNRLQSQTQGNGVSSAYQYNAAGQLTDLQNLDPNQVLLSEFGSMRYDGAGNRTSVTAAVAQAPGASGTTGYAYDDPNQADPLQHRSELTGETSTRNGGYTNSFAYDAAFNLVKPNAASICEGNGNPTGCEDSLFRGIRRK